MILSACRRVTICRAGATGAGEGKDEDVEELAISSYDMAGDGPLLGEDSVGEDAAAGEGADIEEAEWAGLGEAGAERVEQSGAGEAGEAGVGTWGVPVG
jgi:hypothetical protein